MLIHWIKSLLFICDFEGGLQPWPCLFDETNMSAYGNFLQKYGRNMMEIWEKHEKNRKQI